MVSVKNTNFLTVLRVPDVDPAVTGARDDELGVRREGSLQWKLLGVEMTCGGEGEYQLFINFVLLVLLACEGLKRGSGIGVNELDH